jgi:hypothetical protein
LGIAAPAGGGDLDEHGPESRAIADICGNQELPYIGDVPLQRYQPERRSTAPKSLIWRRVPAGERVRWARGCRTWGNPINEEGTERAGQIQEYLDRYRGEGIQRVALASDDLPASVDALRGAGVRLLETPDTYYERVDRRIPGHGEDVAALRDRRILIDGKPGELLLQIFSENQFGPIFFEFIQRKGDQGFGAGNFKALFESIELDQMRRGVLAAKD